MKQPQLQVNQLSFGYHGEPVLRQVRLLSNRQLTMLLKMNMRIYLVQSWSI